MPLPDTYGPQEKIDKFLAIAHFLTWTRIIYSLYVELMASLSSTPQALGLFM